MKRSGGRQHGVDWRAKLEELEELVKKGLTDAAIGEEMGCSAPSAQAARLRYLGPKRKKACNKYDRGYIKQVARHYYHAKSRQETIEFFGLTPGQFHNIMTIAYRDGIGKRKDLRRKDAWSLAETLFMLRHLGIKPRGWIANELGRGADHAVKEHLVRLGCASRHFNGPPTRWLVTFWPHEMETVKTSAGPGTWKFRMAPWVSLTRSHSIDPQIDQCVRIMAKFQKWIFQEKTNKGVLEQINGILRKRGKYGKRDSQARQK